MDSCVRVLPDYARQQNRGLALEKVGIKRFKQYQRDFSGRRTLTRQSAYVDLVGQNGIHMSRLSSILRDYNDDTIRINSDLLERLIDSHTASSAYWDCKWETAFQMENEQDLFIECALEGVMTKEVEDWFLTLTIPYASVCPCASEMCETSRDEDEVDAVPHMQRAEAVITGQLDPDDDLDDLMTTIVARVVNVVDLVPIPVMKRDIELEWCQRAAQTKLFVEDAARVIGDIVDGFMDDWVVAATHFESIHQHEVVAVCRKGRRLV